MNSKNINGVRDFLEHISTSGKGYTPYAEYERIYGIDPTKYPGHRAKKLAYRFMKSDLGVNEFMEKHIKCIPLFDGRANDQSLIVNGGVKRPVGERSFRVTGDGAVFEGKTTKSIRSLEEALEFSDVDLTMWEVSGYQFNSWDVTMKIEELKMVDGVETKMYVPTTVTNYGCNIRFVPKKVELNREYNEVIEKILEYRPAYVIQSSNREVDKIRTGVLNLADFHIGAEISNLLKTPDFNVDILKNHLSKVANIINDHNYDVVVVNMLGDYFESISGLNHLNTFKSLGKGMYGSNVIILATVILGEFLAKIRNLKKVKMISGNHDRFTDNSQIDNEGGAAAILSHILSVQMPSVDFSYHTYLLNPDIDGIRYILTHGHYKIDKKDVGKIIAQHGNQNSYTIWLSGHIHSRHTEKTMIHRPMKFETHVAVSMDEAPYRKIILPSLFTGNFYSETLGYTSTGGCVVTENNGNGKLNVFDYSL